MRKIDISRISEEMEKECASWEASEGLSEDARKQLMEEVREAEIRKEMEQEFRKKKTGLQLRYIACTIAVLMMASSVGVLGERIWRMESTNHMQEGELHTNISNRDQENHMLREDEIYQEIWDKLGIVPIKFGYLPEGMIMKSYHIASEVGTANLEYVYLEKIIYVQMCKENAELEGSIHWDGTAKKVELEQEELMCDIEAYCVDQENHNYCAVISYEDAHYDIQGRFEDESVFLEILYGIFFENQ